MLILQNISYFHPNKDLLFSHINLSVDKQEKVALIGHNGSGKSTLLKLIAGQLPASEGLLLTDTEPHYIPQIFGQFNHLRIAEALGIDKKMDALHAILKGSTDIKYFNDLDDDWSIEERSMAALEFWELQDLNLRQKMDSISGGQKTRVLLAGISIHQSPFILLDEPSNHLDQQGRKLLSQFMEGYKGALILVSHDRQLLNQMEKIYELNAGGIKAYGGNYAFYKTQKQLESNALTQDIQSKEKALRKAKEKERLTMERQQKLDSRGRAKQEKAGVAKIMLNTLRNMAENSTARAKSVHAEKLTGISNELHELRSSLPDIDKMKFGFTDSVVHKGKILISATELNYSYDTSFLWSENLNFDILSGERIALSGSNGSGKTTLINLILGKLACQNGHIFSTVTNAVYIDQDYSLIVNSLTVLELAESFNTSTLKEHEVKIRLSRFLFSNQEWDKPCSTLSGGERMRLMLCCLTLSAQPPDLIILDEPTNNLDIQNIEILTAAINEYSGTLLVVSHDQVFLDQILIQKNIAL